MNNILIRPIITERSLKDAALGYFTFEVDKRANKTEIGKSVAAQFNVHPVSVKTLIKKGEYKRNRKTRVLMRLPEVKKAFIKLKQGEKIDLFEIGGVENA